MKLTIQSEVINIEFSINKTIAITLATLFLL
jgi:hypothetical protein